MNIGKLLQIYLYLIKKEIYKVKAPMTSKQADEKYLCKQCQVEGYGACEFECVLSSTCSMRCPECNNTVYFSGDLRDTPKTYICPYCEKKITNYWFKELKDHRKLHEELKEKK
jgi:hypothetical protein